MKLQFTCKLSQCLLFQPYSRCECPWLIKWLLGYEDLDDVKDKENTDSKIKKYLQGVKGWILSYKSWLMFMKMQISAECRTTNTDSINATWKWKWISFQYNFAY